MQGFDLYKCPIMHKNAIIHLKCEYSHNNTRELGLKNFAKYGEFTENS